MEKATNFYREDYPGAKYVELEEHGIIKLSELPIVLDYSECHQLEWCVINGKHAIGESMGCQPICHGGVVLNVIKVLDESYSSDEQEATTGDS